MAEAVISLGPFLGSPYSCRGKVTWSIGLQEPEHPMSQKQEGTFSADAIEVIRVLTFIY